MRVFHNIFVLTRSYSDRQRTASFLKASLPTDCVLLVSQLVNELRSSFAQTSCKECASLRQAVRSALRSAGRKGSTRSYSDRQRTASFLKASLPTDCVLAKLRQAVRSALRSAGRKGSTRE